MQSLIGFIVEQTTSMGLSGAVIAGLLIVVMRLWATLQKEHKNTISLAGKLQELSKETMAMIERISGR